jgi:2-hydroxy-6-oxonona-2,4-dienedioate hydrolase
MDAATDTRFEDKFVEVGEFRIRYLVVGEGPVGLLFHGASLGSSADVFRRNLAPLAAAGRRVITFDFPGFGLSSYTEDGSVALKKKVTGAFMDAMGIDKAALVGHSQAGNICVALALEMPERVSHVVILGTGSLLPPLESGVGKKEGAAQARLESRMAKAEPTIEDTRKLLEANLFHHELITDAELNLRHSRSIGENFKAFCARQEMAEAAKAKPRDDKKPSRPLWERLIEVKQPLLMIYGREDRARAAERFALLRQMHPDLDMHMAEGCKHLVPWDAVELFHRLAVPFLKS